MKYAVALIAFAAGALAVPQQPSSITSAPVTTPTPSLSPQLSCVATCSPGDVTCQAACLGIARPNESQVIDTTNCAAKCDQGDGSPEATEKYAKCQQDCYFSKFPSSQTAFPVGNAAPNSASPASSAASAGASATGSAGSVVSSRTSSLASGASPTASGSGSRASASASASGAANANSVKIVGAGLAGFLAVFAL